MFTVFFFLEKSVKYCRCEPQKHCGNYCSSSAAALAHSWNLSHQKQVKRCMPVMMHRHVNSEVKKRQLSAETPPSAKSSPAMGIFSLLTHGHPPSLRDGCQFFDVQNKYVTSSKVFS
ncbi:hypothetical protein BaRGS_00009818 [Batillaria attramentaria]|uniref:Uncharacterized protein n=1 Tax=Batillaria attramentaria TaxID=370345 RepID=A0ABD0LHP8_9CAEN